MHRLHCTFWINAAAWNPGDGWGNQNMVKSQNREFLSQMFVCMFFAEAHIFSSYTKPHKHVQKQANSAHKGLCHFLFAFTLSACSRSVSFLCLSLSEYFSIDEPITDDNTVQHQHPFSLSLSPSLQHTHTHMLTHQESGYKSASAVYFCAFRCECVCSAGGWGNLTAWRHSNKLHYFSGWIPFTCTPADAQIHTHRGDVCQLLKW